MADTSSFTQRRHQAGRSGVEHEHQPKYEREGLTLYLGDCVDAMTRMPECSVDTIITDPPYGLEFMGLTWDRLNRQPPQTPSDDNSVTDTPSPSGAIQAWHHRWAIEALRVARPGAMLLAFGGTRTFHRLTCALEDAGWQIRDCLMWLNGQGFPKSHNVGNSIDKLCGCGNRGQAIASGNKLHPTTGKARLPGELLPKYEGRTPEGRKWAGWGTGLKPAWEPIILAMKPLDGTFARNAIKHGVAGLNIDRTRIGVMSADHRNVGRVINRSKREQSNGWGMNKKVSDKVSALKSQGRWPANVLLTHHPDCEFVGLKHVRGSPTSKTFHQAYKGKSVTGFLRGFAHPGNGHADSKGMETVAVWDCLPNCPVQMLDQQSGNRRAGGNLKGEEPSPPFKHCYGEMKGRRVWASYDDIGGASRFL